MEDIKSVVGSNLKSIRKSRQLTLEALSKLTEVSVSMLGEIERGITNPTITVLWKIAEGLKIPFTDLINEKKPPVAVVHNKDAKIFIDEDGFRITSLFGFDPAKKMEIYYETLEPGAVHESKSHPAGIEEYVLICDGTLDLQIGEEKYILSKGDSINFNGNTCHCYRNDGNSVVNAYMILYYGSTQTP